MNQETTPDMRQSYREGKRRLRSIRWMLFFIAAAATAITAFMSLLSSFFAAPPPPYLQILLIELFAYLLPLSIYTRSNRLLGRKEARCRLGLGGCRKVLWLPILLGGIGCQFVMILCNLPMNLFLSAQDAVTLSTPIELIASLFVVALIPAVCEEYLFRGIVYGVMKEFNTKAAAIFTTVIFAFLHGSVTGFLGYLFLGVSCLYILRRSGSLYACMAFHLMNNVTALLLSYFNSALMDDPAVTLLLFLFGILALVLSAVFFTKMTTRPAAVRKMRTADLLGQSVINLPIVLCILCTIGVLILQ